MIISTSTNFGKGFVSTSIALVLLENRNNFFVDSLLDDILEYYAFVCQLGKGIVSFAIIPLA